MLNALIDGVMHQTSLNAIHAKKQPHNNAKIGYQSKKLL
jgi:hypothetical protein